MILKAVKQEGNVFFGKFNGNAYPIRDEMAGSSKPGYGTGYLLSPKRDLCEASRPMTTLRTLLLVIAGIIVVIVLIFAVPVARRGVFCSEIVNPYELVVMYIVTVPEAGHARYDEDFIRFARTSGLEPNSGKQMMLEAGGSRRFLNFQTTACDGAAWAWSENVAKPDEFVVTFHYNRIFGRRRAEEIRAAFIREFRGRYKVEREISWDKRVPVGPRDALVDDGG